MNGILDEIERFLRDLLESWIQSNIRGMFTSLNSEVADVTTEVALTPSTWNSSIYTMIINLSDNIIMPIAGMVITYVLCHELISMVMEKNNMHDFDTSLFMRYILKACLAVFLLSNTSTMVMAFFDVGSHIVLSAGGIIAGATDINVETQLLNLMATQLPTMDIGTLFMLAIESLIINLAINLMSIVIGLVLAHRMVEIYFYISVAPIPFATITNREWGSVGSNYIRSIIALAFQGFLIMVCVAIYSALITTIVVGGDIETALWEVIAYTVLLTTCLFTTNRLSKSIFNAH